jgi:hypothetical protein
MITVQASNWSLLAVVVSWYNGTLGLWFISNMYLLAAKQWFH